MKPRFERSAGQTDIKTFVAFFIIDKFNMFVLVSWWYCYLYVVMKPKQRGRINSYACLGKEKGEINLLYDIFTADFTKI